MLIKLKILKKYKSLKSHFKDRIYFEIQRHGENEEKNFENLFIKLL